MLRERTNAHPAVYLLADHLDAVLAAGEDMRKLSVALPPAKAGLSAETAQALRQFVEDVQAHELSLLLHLLAAHRCASELPAPDKVLRLVLGLFTGGTAALADAATDCGDPRATEFATAGDPLAYLRSRGLLPDTSCSLMGCVEIAVDERLLIASRVPLGDIMDHAAAVMDALEISYELYSTAESKTAAGTALTTPVT